MRDLARQFAMNEVLPLANELDPVQGEMPDDLVAQMGKMGFFGITIGEEHGGLGLGLFEYVLVTEELARAWMSVASIIARGNGHGGQFPAHAARRAHPARRARRVPRRHGDQRARRRLRRGVHPHPCRARRRRMGPQRPEDVVHVRRPGRLPHRVRPHHAVRPRAPPGRHPQLLHPQGARLVPGRHDGQPHPQDRLPRVAHLGAVAERRPGARRLPARRRQRRR